MFGKLTWKFRTVNDYVQGTVDGLNIDVEVYDFGPGELKDVAMVLAFEREDGSTYFGILSQNAEEQRSLTADDQMALFEIGHEKLLQERLRK